jgi:quinol-cytochrome oxidoreductase complex cytochrome b subunit
MALLKSANLALAFLLELCMLAAFAYWGTQTGSGFLMQLVLGVGVPILAIVIWGVFLAPKSTRRFTGIPYIVLKFIIFGLAALALAVVGQQTLAIIFAIVVLVNIGLGYVWKQG